MSHTSSMYHDTHANTYDRMASKATYNVAAHLIPLITPPITSESYVLDNAAGTGIVSALIKESNPNVRIHAADLSPNVLGILTEQMQAHGWGNVETSVLDSRDLKTLSDNTFTHVITNFGLGSDVKDLDGPQTSMREIWRVLKGGGVAVVSTWAERNFTVAFEETAKRIRPGEEPFEWGIPEEWGKGWWLVKQLEDAGFGHRVQVHSVTKGMEAGSVEELVGNMMLFKDMFFKGYSDEEIAKVPEILQQEVRKLDSLEESKGVTKIRMVAWIGMGWKEEI